MGAFVHNEGMEGIIPSSGGSTPFLLLLATGDPEAIAPDRPFTLWGVSRLGPREVTVTLAGAAAAQRQRFLERQTHRIRGRVRLGTEQILGLMDQVALQAARHIFFASYLCPSHSQRSGPSEGPDACRQCHPVVPLVEGTEPLRAMCQETIHVMIQAHIAEMVEDNAYYSPPQGALVPIRLDWSGPMRGLFPAPPVPVREEDEEERPPLGTLRQPTSAPAGGTVREQPPAI